LFGVCDGHGQYGEVISGYIKDTLPAIIEEGFLEKNLKTRECLRESFI
jgi:serine/threonine protein phosphatase PrpC